MLAFNAFSAKHRLKATCLNQWETPHTNTLPTVRHFIHEKVVFVTNKIELNTNKRGVRFCELCVCQVPQEALYHHITRITTRLIIIYGVYGQLGIKQHETSSHQNGKYLIWQPC